MPPTIDRFTDATAARLLDWLCRHSSPEGREWLEAMRAEAECIDGSWVRLRWAVGALSVARTIHRRQAMAGTSSRLARFQHHPAVLNVLAIAIWVVLLLGLAGFGVRLFFEPSGWPITVAILLSLAIGTVVALVLSAGAAAAVGAGMVAVLLSEIAFHLYFGISVVQGGPAHFAVLSGGIIGAVLGALLHRRASADATAGSLRATLRRNQASSHLAALALAFIGAELLIRCFYALTIGRYAGSLHPMQVFLHPFNDELAHYAVLTAAVLGLLLGAASAIAVPRLAFRAILEPGRKDTPAVT